MKQRTVTIIATYLSKRPIGRLVRVRNVGHDDYLIAIEDVRDGRTQLIHSARDLGLWLRSFKEGRWVMPAAAILWALRPAPRGPGRGRELLPNCIGCCAELMAAGAEELLEN